MKYPLSFAIFSLTTALMAFGSTTDNPDSMDDFAGQGGVILHHYLQATRSDSANASRTAPLQVEIDASVPKLNERGHMKATRVISSVGKITYHVLGFQGDSGVKSQVIARYLEAEQQGQGDKTLTLSPDNYRFRLKGERVSGGTDVYVFQVSPRKKRVGLFKGEVWLDSRTYLPVLEKGRLVKNPSVFFRQVDFEREFAIQNGAAVPAHMSSVINTRIVGKVNLSVAYSSPDEPEAVEAVVEGTTANPIRN